MSNDNLSAGSIMLDRLGNSIAIIKGKKPSVINLEPISDSALPYILIESFGGKYRQFTDDATCKRAYEDDVLLVWDGERAGLSSYGHSGYIGSTLAAIRVKDTKLKPNYLFRIFEKEREWLRGNSEGTGVPHLSRWAVENIIYFKPPLPEQQKIATILSSVDDVIEKTRAQIDKLKDLKTAMMQELLTKGIGHTEFKDSPVGRIPTAWKVMPLGSICDLEVGYAFKSSWFSDSGVRLLRGDNVGYGQPTWERIHYLPEEQSKTYSKYLLAAGDVIIGMDRTFTKSGVKVTKLRESDAPALLVQRVGKFLPKKCTKEFLWQLVRSPNFTKALKNQEKGMDIPHLSKTEILEPTVAVPSLGEQADIAKILDSQDVVLDRKQKKITHLEQIKKALMQDLLTGKVRVKLQKDMLKNVE